MTPTPDALRALVAELRAEVVRLRVEANLHDAQNYSMHGFESRARALGIEQAADRLESLIGAGGWLAIESAPTGRSVLLATRGSSAPMYCGRLRFGTMGEPQQNERAWRCDSSGRFAHPTHFHALPTPPGASDDR
jgi:hypothetical protein